MVLDNLDNQDRLWKDLKKGLPQTSTTAETFCLVEDEVVHDTSKNIANCFNRFFITVGAKLAEQFQNVMVNPTDKTQISAHHPFKFTDISVDFAVKELNHLDIRKATCLDNINAKILTTVSHLVASVTDIMISSLKYGKVPLTGKNPELPQYFPDCIKILTNFDNPSSY